MLKIQVLDTTFFIFQGMTHRLCNSLQTPTSPNSHVSVCFLVLVGYQIFGGGGDLFTEPWRGWASNPWLNDLTKSGRRWLWSTVQSVSKASVYCKNTTTILVLMASAWSNLVTFLLAKTIESTLIKNKDIVWWQRTILSIPAKSSYCNIVL